jgi:hypothetical protein
VLAISVMALANGLGAEEIPDPGSAPDDPLGNLLGALLLDGGAQCPAHQARQ